MSNPGKLHGVYKDDTSLLKRNNQRKEFEAGNYDRAFSDHDNFTKLPVDNTTGDPTEYTTTVVEAGSGDSTASLRDAVGGQLRLQTAGNETDSVQIQKPEVFKLASGKKLWYAVNVAMSSITQMDMAIGLCVTTTTVTDGVTDGVFFRTVDGETALDLVTEKNSAETEIALLTTMVATTAYTMEFEFDGTNVDAYLDGVLKGTTALTIPDDEEVAITFAIGNGEAAVATCDIDWFSCTQLR